MSDNQPIDLTSPCGVYCGACPSYIIRESCYGCRPEDRSQKRISKWRCKIRQCCLDKNKFAFCYQCDDFPCQILVKFQKYHLGDKRSYHRAKSIGNLKQISELGINSWLKQQQEIWRCPECNGRLVFYEFRCVDCDYRLGIEGIEGLVP